MDPVVVRLSDSVTIIHGDCRDVLPVECDAVVTDPPYGITGQKWDKDVLPEVVETFRSARHFCSLCCQGQTMFAWYALCASAKMRFCEHIVWVKRLTLPSYRLSRTHESILIFSTSKTRKFFKTKGPYEDVKIPGLLVDVVNVESVKRHTANLRAIAKGKKPRMNPGGRQHDCFSRYENKASERSPDMVNYSNAWSFFPPNVASKAGTQSHPTRKPIMMFERLVEMLSPVGGVVCDPFTGSGTTGIACIRTGRKFIGIEKDDRYFDIARNRLEKELRQGRLPLEFDTHNAEAHGRAVARTVQPLVGSLDSET